MQFCRCEYYVGLLSAAALYGAAHQQPMVFQVLTSSRKTWSQICDPEGSYARRKVAPWPSGAQVEQDLILSRALVELYGRPEIAQRVAFRGGRRGA